MHHTSTVTVSLSVSRLNLSPVVCYESADIVHDSFTERTNFTRVLPTPQKNVQIYKPKIKACNIH